MREFPNHGEFVFVEVNEGEWVLAEFDANPPLFTEHGYRPMRPDQVVGWTRNPPPEEMRRPGTQPRI